MPRAKPSSSRRATGARKTTPKKKTAVSTSNRKLGRLLPPKAARSDEKTPPAAASSDDPIATDIIRRLREALTPSTLSVQNLSAGHRRHASAKKHGGGHYSIFVVSDLFIGLNLMQRQQWIHALLGDLLNSKKIHALEMKLKNSDETSSI